MKPNPKSNSEIVLYQTADVRTINEHIQNVFAEGELQRGATIQKFRIARQGCPIPEAAHD